MRLHHLSVTAFGPFVDTAEADLDALSDSGLFLLSGPTGSGKSSVLDAVCFALYGAVPGDRQQAGRLRSDQAPSTLAPSVTLELTLGARRLRIVRSPAWRRPKRRGEGTTPEQARVTVTELVGGEWVHLSSRLDEAGDLLSGLLGMNLDQFCQVALLPQGRFQAFLRARPDDRQRLLARLFHTGRFERVEAWLRDHRLTLRRASDEHGRVVADLVSRISEAASSPVPDPISEVARAADDGSLAAWAAEIRDECTAARAASGQAVAAAAGAEVSARAARDGARSLATARRRVVEAAEAVERLDGDAATHAADQARLELARRAEGLRPLVRLADERRRALDDAQAGYVASRAAAESAGLDPDDLAHESDRVTRALARLSAVLPVEQRLTALHAQVADTGEALASVQAQERLVAAESETSSARVAELEAAVERTAVAATELAGAERAVAAAGEAAAAHDRLARLVPEHEAVVAEHGAAVRRLLDAREQLLDLRERRIAGMAAELAGALVVGDDCPVCGSTDHPRPAATASGHPDAGAERAAQRAVDDAQVVEHALDLRMRELAAAVREARSAAGEVTADVADERLSAARAALHELRTRAERHAELADDLAALRARLEQLDAAGAELRVRRAELQTRLDHLRAQADELTLTVTEARGEHPAIDAAVTALEDRRDLVRGALADVTRRESAQAALADAESALFRAAGEAGFADIEAVREAEASPLDLADLERRVRERESELRAARAVLDEPDAWELLTAPEPDVVGCERRHAAATEAFEQARAADGRAAEVDDRVRRLIAELDEALAHWRPVRERLALVTAVSSFAEGKASDNRLQMRLSAYVLAYRLSQVVAAANDRLSGMSDRRYCLEHVGRRGAGEARGGLSLVVRDDWSGEARDPATLSGGETFVVSLALALGLADVVSHEAGGSDLQTLFVDEGFGSLDAETLDDVLDILDGLRENGRAVGVVSHVPEMRDRIPAQLVVGKARSGSTLQVVGCPG